MKQAELRLRREVIETCRKMNAIGINQGTSGNISVRFGDGLLLTPSGMDYDALQPEDIVFMRADGSHAGRHNPSSEWRFHRDILAWRPDVGAVVHTHSLYATTLAILGMEIPAVHYMIAAAGGSSIRCAPYATYGTQELSDRALAALEGRKACLLANHGVIATGPSLAKALWLAKEVEVLAQQYLLSLQIGRPTILPDDEVDRIMEKFQSYGPQPQAKDEG
jgi:L-fuculose-phosphate aldolase